MDGPAIRGYRSRRKQRTGRLVHEGHKFIRETGHSASNADPADVRTAADPIHPTTLAHVALDYRPPTSEFHYPLYLAIRFRKLCLLVETAAVAPFVHRLTEQP